MVATSHLPASRPFFLSNDSFQPAKQCETSICMSRAWSTRTQLIPMRKGCRSHPGFPPMKRRMPSSPSRLCIYSSAKDLGRNHGVFLLYPIFYLLQDGYPHEATFTQLPGTLAPLDMISGWMPSCLTSDDTTTGMEPSASKY